MCKLIVVLTALLTPGLPAQTVPPSSNGLNNPAAIYAAGVLRNAPHRAAAIAWLSYLKSDEAQAAYREFGFKSIPSTTGKR